MRGKSAAMLSTYLDSDEKNRHLREFGDEQAHGNVDFDAIDPCNRLNKYSGVVVTQCCTGHMVKPHPEGSPGEKEGYISLRLSKARHGFFLSAVVRDLHVTVYVTSVFTTWEMIDGEIRPRHVVTFEPGRLPDVVDLNMASFAEMTA